jgi:lipid II:glycine glycyltransferase (peptidoglycan interpeptide bridge formation enzyme)
MKIKQNLDSHNLNKLPYVFSKQYHDHLKDCGHEYIQITDDQELITIPILSIKSRFLKIFTLLYPPMKENERLDKKTEHEFIDKLLIYIREKRLCDRISRPFLLDRFKTFPKNSTYKPFAQINLSIKDKTQDEIFSGFKPNYRNEIKKCIAKKAYVKFGEDQFNTFYTIYKNTLTRQGFNFDNYQYVKSLFDELNKSQSVLCGVVYYNDTAQGCVLIPYSKFSGYYLYGGSVQSPDLNGLMKLLQWEVIKKLKENNITQYSFGGARMENVKSTKYEGIQNFKMRFGCTLNKGFIWRKDINHTKCKIYDVLYFVRYRLIRNQKSNNYL